MELHESLIKATFGSEVLIDHGDLIQEYPRLPQKHIIQPQAYMSADWIDVWDRGGVSVKCELNVVREYASRAAAIEAQLDHVEEVAALRDEELTLEVLGIAKVYTLSEAAIETATPQVLTDLGGRYISWTYSITASDMSTA